MTDRITLPPARDTPLIGRAWLRERLAGEEGELVETVTLLASELMTNAVLYARTDVSLSLERHEAGVDIEVCDGSALLPMVRETGPDAIAGRGLAILEQLATSWGAEPLPGAGKRVWFRVERRKASAARSPLTARGARPGTAPAAPATAGDGAALHRRRPVGPEQRGETRRYRFLNAPLRSVERAWREYGAFYRELRIGEGVERGDREVWSHWERAEAIAPDLRFLTRLRDEIVEAATREGTDHVDVSMDLDPRAGEAAVHLARFFDAAERRHADGDGLLLPLPSEESLQLRRWLLGEVMRQSEGLAPSAWRG